jgi:hypothetical protein
LLSQREPTLLAQQQCHYHDQHCRQGHHCGLCQLRWYLHYCRIGAEKRQSEHISLWIL